MAIVGPITAMQVAEVRPAQAQGVRDITHTNDVTDRQAQSAMRSVVAYMQRLGLSLDVGMYFAHIQRAGGRLDVTMIHWQRQIDVLCWDGPSDMSFSVDATTFAVVSGGPWRPDGCASLPKASR